MEEGGEMEPVEDAKKAVRGSSITVDVQIYRIWQFKIIYLTSLHLNQIELQVSWFILFFRYQFGSNFKIINPLDISRALSAGTRPMAKPAARQNNTQHIYTYRLYINAWSSV